MLPHLAFFGLLVAASALFALLEIQVEGTSGWAESLPTWSVENRWTRLVLGSRPLTGYHLYAFLFVLSLLHVPYAVGAVGPSWGVELRLLAFYVLFWVVEDFLWFVLNPAYGLERFRPGEIWWHADGWWWIMPGGYWVFLPSGVALYVVSWVV